MLNQIHFSKDICDGVIDHDHTGTLTVKGQMKSSIPKATIYYWAAAPVTRGISFSGSGMPYPNPSVAYDRTPNKGTIESVNGQFTFSIKRPNAYYIGLGSLYIPPHINFKISIQGMPDNYFSVQIDDGTPFRMLTYPAPPTKKPRISPMFYCEPEQNARTQESILRASAYPSTNTMPDNFWGLRPPR